MTGVYSCSPPDDEHGFQEDNVPRSWFCLVSPKKYVYIAFRCTNIGFSCGFLSSLEPGPPVLESRGRPPELALRLEKQTPYVAQTGTGRRLESVPYAPWLYMGVMNLCESFFDRMKRQLYRKLDRH